MLVTLVRHGKTQSNLEHRYQGRLDDPLCEQGIALLQKKKCEGIYPKPDMLICSPKKRCLQTAQIICGANLPIIIEEDLRETDFGDFEGKTYEELKTVPEYIAWLNTNGEEEIPNGESREEMSRRCLNGFCRQMKRAVDENRQQVLMVVHGGSIMAILERFADSNRPFYDFHVDNGDGFSMKIDRWDEQMRYPVCPIGGKER